MQKAIFYVFATFGTAVVSACSTTNVPETPENQTIERRSKEATVLECAANAGITSSFQVTKGIAGGRFGYSVASSNALTDQQVADANTCIRLNGAGLPTI